MQGPIIAIISLNDLIIFFILIEASKIILFRHPLQPECIAQIILLFKSAKKIGAQSAVKTAREIFFFCVMLPSATVSSFKFLLSISSTCMPCI